MDNLIEEYGLTILAFIFAMLFIPAIQLGFTQDGFLGEAVVNYISSIIGG